MIRPSLLRLEQVLTGVARELVAELDCAVVAMRYPVTDDFAIAFTGDLYERLLSREQPLRTALAPCHGRRWQVGHRHRHVRLSAWRLPALFGARAAGLALAAPRGAPRLDPAEVRMERFPPEPPRFVGRARAMASASATLAPNSGRTGVLLHGMAGTGKTACALKLAYRHQDSFAAVVFWQTPRT